MNFPARPFLLNLLILAIALLFSVAVGAVFIPPGTVAQMLATHYQSGSAWGLAGNVQYNRPPAALTAHGIDRLDRRRFGGSVPLTRGFSATLWLTHTSLVSPQAPDWAPC
jgi:hypothetical protein